ncbi:MAG TPA: MarR family transcriptional regulator [Chloroflexota bacterium]|jgi:DNA-binding MarR family transcriptional regulator|nr:MarR family transcriptional regulator [Chloroflexota bacterium]
MTDRNHILAGLLELNRCLQSRFMPAMASDWVRLELTTAQLKVLFCLAAGGEQPMSQLAHSLNVGLPAATGVVDKLVDAGLAERAHSEADRRVVLVRPSERGVATITALRSVQADTWRQILSHVSDEDLETLAAANRIMLAAINRDAEERAGASAREPVAAR